MALPRHRNQFALVRDTNTTAWNLYCVIRLHTAESISLGAFKYVFPTAGNNALVAQMINPEQFGKHFDKFNMARDDVYSCVWNTILTLITKTPLNLIQYVLNNLH